MALVNPVTNEYYRIMTVNLEQSTALVARYENLAHRQAGDTIYHVHIEYPEQCPFIADKMNDAFAGIEDATTIMDLIKTKAYDQLKTILPYSEFTDV